MHTVYLMSPVERVTRTLAATKKRDRYSQWIGEFHPTRRNLWNWNNTRNFARNISLYRCTNVKMFISIEIVVSLNWDATITSFSLFQYKIKFIAFIMEHNIRSNAIFFGFNSQTWHTLSNFPVYSRVMGGFISLISVVILFFDSLIIHEFSEKIYFSFLWNSLSKSLYSYYDSLLNLDCYLQD